MFSEFREKGFTLVELMIVVAIIGILAALAIPAFVTYMNRAKASEADGIMETMATGAISYYEGNQQVHTNDEHWHHTDEGHVSDLEPGMPVPAGDKVFPGGDGGGDLPILTHDNIPVGGGQMMPRSDFGEDSGGSEDGLSGEELILQALNFGLDEATYFKYVYNANESGTDAEFAMWACHAFDSESNEESGCEGGNVGTPESGTAYHTVIQRCDADGSGASCNPRYVENEFQ